jgi:regulator of cell morphogenesis and NO signaling
MWKGDAMKIDSLEPVGKIAAEHPRTIPLLEGMRIDYCCGGLRSLKDACALAGVPVEKAVSSLEAVLDQEPPPVGNDRDWRGKPLSELTGFIVQKHHAYTRGQLARLKELSAKVRSAHGERHPELARLGEILLEMAEEMEGHMAKEEEQVFPYLEALERSGGRKEGIPDPFRGGPLVNHPIEVLMWEHGMTGEEWNEIHGLTNDLKAPPDACGSYRALYEGLKELEGDLHQHVHLENNILFAKVVEKGWLD